MTRMEDNIKVPRHVSIIMDGNGRWAKARGQRREFGHIEGVESVRSVTKEAVRQGVKYLSLFTFSEENWGRPAEEVEALMGLMMKAIHREVPMFTENGVRFLVLGNKERLSAQMQEAIRSLEELTAANDRMTMILFLSYSGKWDILQAAKKMAADMAAHPDMDPEIADFDKYLVTAGIPDPDLVIRTSGEQRISNYLLWQSAYSEYLFTDTLWPDFKAENFVQALKEYSGRDRRYGKVK
ncbi:MAG: di-trans,poly-cis-decaprenylcistransferase [Bacteroidales bacterium]|nr:di-trans,poly-cis-decaprenylcistransferase [Bacteroidales bacterium]